MKEVFIKAKIKNEDSIIPFEGKGVYDLSKSMIQYQDKDTNAVLTIFLNDNIMLRETEDTILSYKFVENAKTNFEVFLKDLKQTGYVPLTTRKIAKTNTNYQVTYNIEGNDFDHTYEIEWRIL